MCRCARRAALHFNDAKAVWPLFLDRLSNCDFACFLAGRRPTHLSVLALNSNDYVGKPISWRLVYCDFRFTHPYPHLRPPIPAKSTLSHNVHNPSPGAQGGGIFFLLEPMPLIGVYSPSQFGCRTVTFVFFDRRVVRG